MAQAARQAGVPIVTADTKVVERDNGDGIFITTTGVGVQPPARELGGALARRAMRSSSRARSAIMASPS
jgi:hydrogenase expression/formation protein HypE